MEVSRKCLHINKIRVNAYGTTNQSSSLKLSVTVGRVWARCGQAAPTHTVQNAETSTAVRVTFVNYRQMMERGWEDAGCEGECHPSSRGGSG
jgi:hypothetical protein